MTEPTEVYGQGNVDDPLPTPTPNEVARHRAWWVTALVDGGYRQAHGALRVDEGDEACFCCLGVAEDLRRGRDAWEVVRGGADHVGSHDLPDHLDDDQPGGSSGRQGIALTKATRAWLGLRVDNPAVVFRTEKAGDWQVDTLAELNDALRFDLVRIATVLADQPADWIGDAAEAGAEALRRDRLDARAGHGDHDYDEGDDPEVDVDGEETT